MAAQIIRGKKPKDIPIQKLSSNRLYLNLSAAKTQGVKFPEELVRKASQIIQ